MNSAVPSPLDHRRGIPVTVLTGFLGSGKTTLLNHLLSDRHGLRLAVIENEFGAENVDARILVTQTRDEIVETENGCLCCTVRGDLKRALVDLQKRRSSGDLQFERVVIETTGLAQPAPVVQTLLTDAYLSAHYRLDGVVTLVDAFHGPAQLDRHPEAQEQVGFADRLVVTKPDLVDAPVDWVLDVGGFDADAVLNLHPGFPRYSRPVEHTAHVESFVHRSEEPFDRDRFELLLETLLEWYGPELLRYKGVVAFEGDPRRWILQGVHRQKTLALGEPWTAAETPGNVLVFIGTRLPRPMLTQGLDKCTSGAAVQ